MRKWFTRILICLLLGALTTVGVAWGFALSKTPGYVAPIEVSERDVRVWNRYAPQGWPELPWSASEWRSAAYACRLLVALDNHDETVQLGEELFGWPLQSLAWNFFDSSERGPWYIYTLPSNPGLDNRNIHEAMVPLRPLFPGFLIDTLFYGVLWFGLFFGFGAARRAIRRKRGRCVNCGYDLRGDLDAGCSECGWGWANDWACGHIREILERLRQSLTNGVSGEKTHADGLGDFGGLGRRSGLV